MTETEVKLSELQQKLAHLTAVSEEGWLLQWGNTPQTAFEIVCRKANAVQVERLEAVINEGYQKTLLARS